MRLMRKLVAAAILALGVNHAALAQTCPSSPYTLTNGANADASQVMANFNNLLNCINSRPGLVFAPAGRLTLTTGTPVLTSAVSAAGTVYYTPYTGNLVPVWTGTGFVAATFAELSNVLANSSAGNAGPAAAIAGSIYDLFVWSNAGVMTLTRSPAWANATTRSTAITRVSGLLTNSVAITNGPAAGFGTYVGTIMTDDAGATVSYIPATGQPGGSTAIIGLWNNFNRREVVGTASNTNATWTVIAVAPREIQGGLFRVRFIIGLSEDIVSAIYKSLVNPAPVANTYGRIGIGLDQSVNFDQSSIYSNNLAGSIWYSPTVTNQYQPQSGRHYIAALENSDGGNYQTFYGGTYSQLAVKYPY
ncbi:hypothetical protein SAMN05216304_10927 [Bosea sp. OK403]|uniref:hypothetical protein n=1 Tax=Bosea sp. OK403 TaxID=1855286 RepID=UPI0008DFEE27|nr:hypothetical protein [Bosea sp. OK403]SFJ52049.1 hypothetical protein SAMN05216304_10927 [Bosea sp. OK403]